MAVPVLEDVLADILAQEETPAEEEEVPQETISLVEELEILTIEEGGGR